MAKYSDLEKYILDLKEDYDKSLKRTLKDNNIIYIPASSFMKIIKSMTDEDIENALNKYKYEMGRINNVSKTGIDENICK